MELIAAVLVTAFGVPAEVTPEEMETIRRELGHWAEGIVIRSANGRPGGKNQLIQYTGGES
jgi:hypothetical protein